MNVTNKNNKNRLNYKKSISIFFFIVCLFVGFHFITWNLFTKKILSGNNNGDLARLAYLPQFKHLRDFTDDLPRRHIEFSEFKGGNVDVLTIGDSFSNGKGGGRNRFYQDYLASKQNINVININPYTIDPEDQLNPFHTLILLLNSGLIDDLKPQIILIESVERFACNRASKINFDLMVDKNKLLNFYSKKYNKDNDIIRNTFINNGNLKYYLSQYKLYAGYKHIYNVALADLDRKLFSLSKGNILLFPVDELKAIQDNYELCVNNLNKNINMLSDILIKKDIKLYFMLVVDKYNLYSKFIVNNPFKKSSIFELMELENKKYYFINTKTILSNELYKNNTQDLFYIDDTHWSWKASELIFSNVTVK